VSQELSISQSSVSRVWRHFRIQPHRIREYMASDDPEFEEGGIDAAAEYLEIAIRIGVAKKKVQNSI
jgi:hypothetical protein